MKYVLFDGNGIPEAILFSPALKHCDIVGALRAHCGIRWSVISAGEVMIESEVDPRVGSSSLNIQFSNSSETRERDARLLSICLGERVLSPAS